MLQQQRRLRFVLCLLLAGCLAPWAAWAAPAGQAPILTIDFEDATPQGFEPRAGHEVLQITQGISNTGDYSLSVSGRQASWNGPSLRIQPLLEQGEEYVISAWVHAITPQSSTFRLSTQIGEGGAATYINLASANVSTADGWTQLTGSYRYANTSSGYITLYIESDSAQAEYAIDDITIEKKEGSALMADLTLPSLAQIYQNDFLIGTAFSPVDLDGVRLDLLRHHFNSVTAENMMKPQALLNAQGEYDFGGADAAIKTVMDKGLSLHGHTLAWHQQSPGHLNQDAQGKPLNRSQAVQNLVQYIQTVAGHFAGRVSSWDVVNEAIMDNPPNPSGWQSALRKSDWFLAFASGAKAPQSGADYVAEAFIAARKADPAAVLYYNDYNLDYQDKAQATAAMVKQINEDYLAQGNDRLLIEGIGMQGHYNMGTKPENVQASIQRFIDLGVRISITELDVTVAGASPDGLTDQQQQQQAAQYARLFAIFKQYAAHIDRVTLWGMDDRSSWRASQLPLLFNANLSAKPAYYAVADPEGFLENYDDTPKAPVIRRQGAAYGSAQIAVMDDTPWQQAPEIEVNQMLQAWQTAGGTARILWDEGGLYVQIKVDDATPDSSADLPYQRDSVEVFLDEANGKTPSLSVDDVLYHVDIQNSTATTPQGMNQGFESAVFTHEGGYTVQMRLPFRRVTPKQGRIIGFDVRIHDAKDGARVGIAAWNDTTQSAAQDTSNWGEIELLAPISTSPSPSADPLSPAPASQPRRFPVPWGWTIACLLLGTIAGVVISSHKKNGK